MSGCASEEDCSSPGQVVADFDAFDEVLYVGCVGDGGGLVFGFLGRNFCVFGWRVVVFGDGEDFQVGVVGEGFPYEGLLALILDVGDYGFLYGVVGGIVGQLD